MKQTPTQRTSKRRRVRSALTSTIALLVAGMTTIASLPAIADEPPVEPRVEIETWWADGTPVSSSPGQVVVAEVRINVNDTQAASGNDEVENFTATFTTAKGVFTEVPTSCVSDGDPVSEISEDGTQLTCNFGTQVEGTALALQVPVRVDGNGGEELTFDAGVVGGPSADKLTHDIGSLFMMDLTLEGSSDVQTRNGNLRSMQFEWTLNWGKDAPVGPNSVEYTLTLDNTAGTIQSVRDCGPFTDQVPSWHPNSGTGSPTEQTAPTADCTLTRIGQTNQWKLTLSNLDYSLDQVPTHSAGGTLLPVDRVAIASGKFWVDIAAVNPGSVKVTADTPTYTSGAQQSVDDPSNNTQTKDWKNRGLWVSSWNRHFTESGGTPHDDSYRVSPGTLVRSSTYFDQDAQNLPLSDANNVALCTILDNKYVEYDSVSVQAALGGGVPTGTAFRWYVDGTDPRLDPNNPSYNPGGFNNCSELQTGVWVTTEPVDKSTVQAVQAIIPYGSMKNNITTQMFVEQRIKSDAPVGMDVWQFSSYFLGGAQGGGWYPKPGQGTAAITPTPNARYAHTSGYRDILRVVGVTPSIEKDAERATVRVGEEVTYTLRYAANGTPTVPTVDGFKIVDTLPVGLTYVEGSATPEPVVTTNGGSQVLTWTLNGVETNQEHTLTYEAFANEHATPGERLENSVVSTVGGRTSGKSVATVTIDSNGRTIIGKSADQDVIPNVDGEGNGQGSWTVSVRSEDPVTQEFTDVIDILPYNGDGRGTQFAGDYELVDVVTTGGGTVYYTTHDPAVLTDDPDNTANGGAGDPTGNEVGWTTTKPVDAAAITAVRVIGGELAPTQTRSFQVVIETQAAEAGDEFVNRAQGRAEHTRLVMRTSAPVTVGDFYSYDLKKFVLGADNEWYDAQDDNQADWPELTAGAQAKYKFILTNTGTGDLTDIVVTDPLLDVTWNVETLASGQVLESSEYTFDLTGEIEGELRNEACAEAPLPEGATQAELVDPCDEANITVSGDPTHTKTLVSATPIGNGQWEVVYQLEVENTLSAPAEYSLVDELRFTDQVDIVSAEVTEHPDGVTLVDPAWDGQTNLDVVTGASILGNEHAEYGAHVYELTIVADVPLVFDPPTGDSLPATECDAEGADTNTAFNNISQLTKPSGVTEDDQACAPLPAFDITKDITGGPTENPDGSWTVTYDVDVTNTGHTSGEYDLYDRLRYGDGINVDTAHVVDSPEGVTVNPGWTGQGGEEAPENLIASAVELEPEETHTYRVEVTSTLTLSEITSESLECPDPGTDGKGGFANTAAITHNGHEAIDEACDTPPTPNTPQLELPVLGGTGLMPFLAGGALLGLLALLARRAQQQQV